MKQFKIEEIELMIIIAKEISERVYEKSFENLTSEDQEEVWREAEQEFETDLTNENEIRVEE